MNNDLSDMGRALVDLRQERLEGYDLFKDSNYRKACLTLGQMADLIVDRPIIAEWTETWCGETILSPTLGWDEWTEYSDHASTTLKFGTYGPQFVTCSRRDRGDVSVFTFSFDVYALDRLQIIVNVCKSDPSKRECSYYKDGKKVTVRAAMPIVFANDLYIRGVIEGWHARYYRGKYVTCDE